MSDPLAQYRKRPVSSGGGIATGESGGYAAFGAKDKVHRLKIKRAFAPTRAPGYAYLLDIAYDGPFGTNFVLVYTFLMVLVRGKNLQPIITALEIGNCDFIQEFDGERWAKPSDSTAPFIESIEVVVKENGGDAVSEAENIGGPSKPH